jgi:hypothetical protein
MIAAATREIARVNAAIDPVVRVGVPGAVREHRVGPEVRAVLEEMPVVRLVFGEVAVGTAEVTGGIERLRDAMFRPPGLGGW